MLSKEEVEILWGQFCEMLKEQFSETRYNSMVELLKPLSYNNYELSILCPSPFLKSSLNKFHKNEFEDILNRLMFDYVNQESTVVFLEPNDDEYKNKSYASGQQSFLPNEQKKVKKSNKKSINSNNTSAIENKYTFDNFVIGNNEFAMGVATKVANDPGNEYNPLFMYGPSGIGKTHLMKAIGYEINKNFDCNVMYISSEKFTTDLIESIKNKTGEDFRKKYRNVDVLLIDDIQFLDKKEATQEEFFHTFNELYSQNKQIVITSDRPPQEIKTLQDRLVGRFNMGLTLDIHVPNYETRVAILEEKIKFSTIPITKEILSFIAMNIKSNVRELEGALITVLAHYNLKKDAPITVEYVKGILSQKLNEMNKRELTIELVKETVANYYKIDVSDLSSKNRVSTIALPRQIAMYLCRNMIDCALGNIGLAFGKDHTTVMHAVKQIDKKIKIQEDLKRDIQNIKEILND